MAQKSFEDAILNLTADLFMVALECADYFEGKCGRSLDSPQYGQLVREFIFIFVHFVDRYSFEMYGHEKRCKITDDLVSLLDALLKEDRGRFKAADQIGNNVTIVRGIDAEKLTERNIEYAHFVSGRNTAEAEEGIKKLTLAFALHLSQVARGIPLDFTCVDLAFNLLPVSLNKLNLDKQLTLLR